jgi:hypothetical protein
MVNRVMFSWKQGTRSEPTRSAEVSPTEQPIIWLRYLQACREIAPLGTPARAFGSNQSQLLSLKPRFHD